MNQRTRSLAGLFIVTAFGTSACAAPAPEETGANSDAIRLDEQAGPATMLPEVVQIVMSNGRDFCTGVLVASDRVVTAAHCLLYDRSWVRWTVRAPNAHGSPSVEARLLGVVSQSYDAVESSDVGVLVLDKPIRLPAYAVLTDVGARADHGETFAAVAVGRAKEAPDAPIVKSKRLHVETALGEGYLTGLKTEMYSEGGDSGGGLFLLENGKPTHKVIGFERQPDPANDVDFFTRVDSHLIALALHGVKR